MRIKIAVFSDYSPLKDYIYSCTLPENKTPDEVITEINSQLKGWHCELVSIEQERTRS